MALPDHTVREVEDAVSDHFGAGDECLKRSAVKLWRDGYLLPGILDILGGAFSAGYDTGYSEGAWDARD